MNSIRFDASRLVSSQRLHGAIEKKIGKRRAMLILQFATNHNVVQKLIKVSGVEKQDVIENQAALLAAIGAICAMPPERLCVALDAYMTLLHGLDCAANDWQDAMASAGMEPCDMDDEDAVQAALGAYVEKNLSVAAALAAVEKEL